MPFSTLHSTPPDKEEFELSIFGPGVGECIVIHLGGGDWAIVDSCLDRNTGNPVALDYLRLLNVPSDAVKQIVAPHWHNDHCRGMSVLLGEYPSAKFVLSVALKANEFGQLIAASRMEEGIGIDELRLALDVFAGIGGAGLMERRTFAIADRPLFTSAHSQVVCLTPSDRTMARSFVEIGSLIQEQQQRRRAASHSQNDVAVVLWIEFKDKLRILLGSDLEKTVDPERGWLAVVNSSLRPMEKAQIFKVAHHGSENADEARVWLEMLTKNAHAVLTPYRLGVKPLPTEQDCARLLSQTTELYSTAPSHAPKPDLNPTVNRVVRRVAKSLRRLEGRMGHVRLRSAGRDVSVELFGPAYRIST